MTLTESNVTLRCIHELVEAQVAQTPDAIAVVFEDGQLSYRDLNRQANQLAHHLRKLGVKPETLVGICVERSLAMVVGLLAILKAGGAYVPLDPNYPRERIALMLEDSQIAVLLTQQPHLGELPTHTAQVVCLDSDWPIIAQESSENLDPQAQLNNLAYIIYTSGSTGKPKGVMIEHRSLANFVQTASREYEIIPDDRVLQFASISFDTAAEEIFPALTQGATLVLRTQQMLRTIPAFLQTCGDWQLTVLDLPTAFWHRICAELPHVKLPETVRLVIIGGEKALPRWLAAWKKFVDPQIRLVNTYGPTESTVVATWCDLAGPQAVEVIGRLLPIGRAIDNTEIFVLNSDLQPVAVGTPGELYIGGAGLARGYLNRPELTAIKFIFSPASRARRLRLYGTGDLVRYREDGLLEFLDRVDHQEKIRGFRVELNEVEAILEEHPAVQDVVVVAREEIPGEKRLVAYIVQNSDRSGSATQFSSADLEAEQVAQWRLIHDDDSFNPLESRWDPTFNISGWGNSYTGQPIPDPEMREWVDTTTARILSLQPRRVLEIGCGTGLMLFRIAPHCLHYHGTDFSQTALRHIQQQLTSPELNLPQVTLSQRMADDLQGIEPRSVDTVIINSVIQYFPSVNYLVRVLEEAIQVLEPGGFIFIGDIRSYPLLEAFAASVELYQAEDSLPIEELRRRVQKRVRQEEELTIDPAFFYALQQQYPQIYQVQVLLREGRHHNELSRFRYDAILQIGPAPRPRADHAWLDWQQQNLTVSALRQRLQKNRPEVLGIRGIPNARVLADVETVAMLHRHDSPKTAGEIRQILVQETQGVDPEELWSLSRDLLYAIAISWLGSGIDGSYDVLLQRRSAVTYRNPPWIISETPARELTLKPWYTYANNPLQGKIAHQLIPQLRAFLKEKLPAYMIPSAFVVLDVLPLTPNGKVDRRALPMPSSARPDLDEMFVAPRTPIEQQLAEIWSRVLGIDQIGVYDNFFELGGDSLRTTQLIFRIEETFQVVVPLIHFFQAPTVAGLVSLIQGTHQTSTVAVTEKMTLSQLRKEATLDQAIRPYAPHGRPPTSPPPQSVFLTGATGFVGAFLLHELLQQTQAKIYCLVRAQNPEDGQQKLRYKLGHFFPTTELPYDRVVPVLGDLTQPRLGIPEQQFQELASILDVIYHSGANVNLVYPYAALRPANVLGTQEVLKLASQATPKPLHYLSTLDVFESAASAGVTMLHEQDSIAQGEGLAGGYAQSKWVAEQMVTLAGARGLPVSIYRPGMITGHSQTGISNTQDLMCRWIKGLVELKSAPDLDLMIDMTPVDYVSRAIVYLSLRSQSYGKAFHLVNPQPLPLQTLIDQIRQWGYAIEFVPYDQWQAILNASPNALSPLSAVLTERISGQTTRLEMWLAGNQVFNSQNVTQGLADSGIVCPPPDAQLLEHYRSYFVHSGFLADLQPQPLLSRA
jgi:amino acid adenylation domain-containing protein/thioester reductase-like protein